MKSKTVRSKTQPQAISPVVAPADRPAAKPAGSEKPRPVTSEPEAPNVVLLAVTGMSPAVLTETLWALAHPVDGQDPVIPHRVVVVTTSEGRRKMETLFEPSQVLGGLTPWEALRSALRKEGLPVEDRLRFGRTADDIRVITRAEPGTQQSQELADIRSRADNEAVADYLLDQVRAFVENPDTQLIASIAGGRKTMSALLYACMTLVGRATDTLTHVLVSEPFEGLPHFWFPGQPGGPVPDAQGRLHDPRQARVELAWVPFVSLHQFLMRELGRKPGTFSRLVDRCRTHLRRQAAENLRITLDTQRARLEVNGTTCELAPAEMLVFYFFALRLKQNEPAFPTYKDAIDELNHFRQDQHQQGRGQMSSWRLASSLSTSWDEHDLARALANLRNRLRRLGPDGALLVDCLPERGRCGLDMSGSLIFLK